MFTEAIALTATQKVLGLALAAGLAASATVAGPFGTSSPTNPSFPSLAPIVVEADLGSMLRFGRGSEARASIEAAAATEAQVDLGIATTAGGTAGATLSTVLNAPQATVDVTAATAAETSTTVDVQTITSAEGALEAEVVVDALAHMEAAGLLNVTLR